MNLASTAEEKNQLSAVKEVVGEHELVRAREGLRGGKGKGEMIYFNFFKNYVKDIGNQAMRNNADLSACVSCFYLER